jgi:tripartite-type tricarboxylate transporter receptor subunit TctC
VRRARQALFILISFAALASPLTVKAQDYPARPIRLVLGLPPGTAGDITARVVGQQMNEELGVPIVIENKTGAGSSLGASLVAHSAPDGYTLFMGAIANVINALTKSNLNFDLVKDFTTIALLTTTPNVLVVRPSLGAKTVADLIAIAKIKPGSIAFGSTGTGTTTHLAIELLNMKAGVKILHIPYPGSVQAVTDLLAGRIDGLFTPASTVLQYTQAGTLVALASTDAKRMALLPNVPTMIEAGMTGFESGIWSGLMAPAGTPDPIIRKLADAANKAIKTKAVVDHLKPLGIEVIGSSPAEFRDYLDAEMKRWSVVVQAAGLAK